MSDTETSTWFSGRGLASFTLLIKPWRIERLFAAKRHGCPRPKWMSEGLDHTVMADSTRDKLGPTAKIQTFKSDPMKYYRLQMQKVMFLLHTYIGLSSIIYCQESYITTC